MYEEKLQSWKREINHSRLSILPEDATIKITMRKTSFSEPFSISIQFVDS